MRILELFAGYGSQALALKNLGIEFTSDISEIDKYAIQAYNQLHGETHNWGDITKIDETKLPYYDLITYSSPCQDFSVAGLGKGGDEGSGTRSSLLWECERIIKAVKPKYLLMENVKNLVGKKHKHNFVKWLRVLENIGYQNYWKVLNSKDYGVPQNRERVFVVSILGGGQYQFPEPIPLTKRLKDVIELNVDKKYYIKKTIDLPQKDISNTIRTGGRGSQDIKHTWDIIKEPVACAFRGRNPENPSDRTVGAPTEQRLEINESGCSNTLTSVQKDNYILMPKVVQVGNIVETDSFGGNPQRGRGYSADVCSPALNTMQGVGLEPKIVQMFNPYNNSEIKDVAPTQLTNCGSTTSSSTVLIVSVQPKIIQSSHGFNKGNVYKIAPTITSSGYENNNFLNYNYRIRKLTPRECWRLMGVKDEQFDKLHDISNTQLYKMAGNSIVVDVLMGIFKNLFMMPDNEIKGQLNLL